MKKIILLILMILSLHAEYNILMAGPFNPNGSAMPLTNLAIRKGLYSQFTKIQRLLYRNNIESVVGFPFEYQNKDQILGRAEQELHNLMIFLYTNDTKNDEAANQEAPTDLNNLTVSNFQQMNHDGLKSATEDTFIRLAMIYSRNRNNDISSINSVGDARFYTYSHRDLVKLNAIYGMVFTPTLQGRTYIMAIRLYLINVNEDGRSVTIMRKDVKNFIWYRNPRYISAVTGRLLREILAQGTGRSIE